MNHILILHGLHGQVNVQYSKDFDNKTDSSTA